MVHGLIDQGSNPGGIDLDLSLYRRSNRECDGSE
jgi:hypothetical protein